jgi:hypothetical protein
MKIKMIHEYEGGQCLFAIVCNLGFVVSTVNIIMKDSAYLKECEMNGID